MSVFIKIDNPAGRIFFSVLSERVQKIPMSHSVTFMEKKIKVSYNFSKHLAFFASIQIQNQWVKSGTFKRKKTTAN